MKSSHTTHQSTNTGGAFAQYGVHQTQSPQLRLVNPIETFTHTAGNFTSDPLDLNQAISSFPQVTPAMFKNAGAHGDMFHEEGFQNKLARIKEAQKYHKKMERHQEIQGWGVEVYNRNEQQKELRIKEILEQLQMLTKDLHQTFAEVKGAQTTVINNKIATGDGSISFLEKLMRVIMMLRKRVKESRMWLHQMQIKQRAKKNYWGMALGKGKGQGMQWAMSLDRSGGEQY